MGRCAVEWSGRGLTKVWLPEAPKVRRDDEPPAAVADAIDLLRRLLAGDDVELTDVQLDLDGIPEFDQRVYAAARALPRGVTATYGELARRIGMVGAAQAGGRAEGHNPFPLVVPCPPVGAARGGHGGVFAAGG